MNAVLSVLRGHARLIIVAGLLGLGFALGALLLLPPTYTASASIVVNPRPLHVTTLPSIISEPSDPDVGAQMRSAAELLGSDDLARRVIEDLQLLDEPGLHPKQSTVGKTIAMAASWARGLVRDVASAWLPARPSEANSDQSALTNAIRAYKSHMTIGWDPRSYVVKVAFKSPDAALAARVVNKHIELYLADQVEYHRNIAARAGASLDSEVQRVQVRLRASQEAVQKFREDNNVAASGGATLIAQQLAAAYAQLPVVTQQRSQLEAQLQEANRLLKGGSVGTQANILQSPTIQRLRDQEGMVVRKLAELSTTYDDAYPTVVKARGELDGIRHDILQEGQRITKGLAGDLQVAQTREAGLRQEIAALEHRSLTADREQSKLHDLEREVTTNQSLLETLLTRYGQVQAEENVQVPDARIVSPAPVPLSPSFPTPMTLLPGGLLVGMLTGTVAAFLREATATGFRTSREMERALPSLGMVPSLPSGLLRRETTPHDFIVERPSSAFSEAVRNIRNSIEAVPIRVGRPRILLVTSSLPGEGKTTLAISLARSFQRAGKRTLLIDCDLRRPSVGRLLSLPESSGGLATVLAGEATIEEVIHQDPQSNLEFVAGGQASSEPQDMLSARATEEIFIYLTQIYEVILLDSPPITAVSDALVLARQADATILAVRWARTHRQLAKASFEKLFANGARACGAVLTQVDVRRGIFSPQEPEFYHRLNQRYYSR